MCGGEDGGGGTAEGFAADDAALGIADHTAGVENICTGGNAGGNQGTDNVNRIGNGVGKVFDISIIGVGGGDDSAGCSGEFAVGDRLNIDAGNHAERLDRYGADVNFVRGEVEDLSRHRWYFLSAAQALRACGFVLNLQFVHKICWDGRIYADFCLKSLAEMEK